MNAKINIDGCIGCGLCPALCPEVFCMQGAKASVCGNVTEQNKNDVMQAVDNCPVSVISLEE